MGTNLTIAFLSSPQDIAIILIVGFILFGAKKLPEMARGLGEGMKEFKKAVREVGEDEPAKPAATPAAESKTEEK